MSGNVSLHVVDNTNTLANGKVKWIAVQGTPDGEALVWVGGGPFVDEANGVAVVELGQYGYETVAAGQTDQVLGGTGAAGDYLSHLIVVGTTSTGTAVSIKDGAGSSIPVLPTGLAVPSYYYIPINSSSQSGAWSVTTGANVTVLAVGRFSA